MTNTLVLGRYHPGDSVLHRLDPRAKLLIAFAWMTALFFVERAAGFLLFGLALLLAYIVSRIPLGLAWAGLRSILLLALIAVPFNAFLTPGEAVWRLGPVTATAEGITLAGQVAARLILLIGSSSLLTFTTSPLDAAAGLEALLRPFARVGLPVHELAMMTTIALRFIPILVDEADRLRRAQMARGAEFERGSPIRRVQALLPLLIPLFVGALRRADELALAMEIRGYRGGTGRTRLRELRAAPRDWVAAGLAAGFTAAALYAGRGGL